MKDPSRKFIDLIHAQTSKWANWNPPNEIKVGDFGIISKETGDFEKEGNIYEDPELCTLANEYPPRDGHTENRLVVCSDSVRAQELELPPGVTVPGIAAASIKGQWKFGSKRGALLIMVQPRSSYIPEKDKMLVTEVVSCPAYCLYLSTANKDVVSIALVENLTVPVAPGISAGGKVGATWWSQNTSGFFRHGCDKAGRYSFTPLYALKHIRKPGIFNRSSLISYSPDVLREDGQKLRDPPDDASKEEKFEDVAVNVPQAGEHAASLSRTKSDLRQTIDPIKMAMKKSEDKHNVDVVRVQQEVEAIEEAKTTPESYVAHPKQTIDSVNAVNEELSIASMDDVARVQQEMEVIKATLEEVKAAHKRDAALAKQTIDSMDAVNEELRAKLGTDAAEAQRTVDNMKADYLELQETIATLKMSMKAVVEEMKADVVQAHEHAAKLQKVIDDMKADASRAGRPRFWLMTKTLGRHHKRSQK